jgi:hypothetical protein
MAVALSTEIFATTVVSTVIVTVLDSEGVIWTVLVSSAWAVSCGNNISHRNNNTVINADLSINCLINPSPLIRAMSNKAIIAFYYTKKGASFLTPLIVGLIKHGPSSGSLRPKR